MIKGIGIDMIEVERVAEKINKEQGFRELVFSGNEICYCEAAANKYEHYAARFAAKEAFFKAMGTGWADGTAFNEIEITPAPNGKPLLVLTGATAAWASEKSIGPVSVFTVSCKINSNSGSDNRKLISLYLFMIYSTQTAWQSKEDITNLQNEKLHDSISYLQQYSPFYRKVFASHKIKTDTIKCVADLQLLPFTTKEDLQQWNDGFLCVPKNKIIEYTSTSGTLGSPVTVALTENDLQRLAFNEYCSFLCADGKPDDIYQLMLTLDRQFMAGMAYYAGIRKMGAGIIRVGPGVPSLQWQIIQRIQPTAIVAVPSFILKLIQYAAEHNIDISNSSVKKAVCIGENIRNTDFSFNILGKKITEAWNIKLYSTYASTEMQTAFTECGAGKGGHHNPDLLVVELLNENNETVAPGEAGEVTITTLGVEAMPLLRYKTGDICMYVDDTCSCGRNTFRLSPVLGRKKQMIKYKGTTLYPPALFDLLNEMVEVLDYVAEVYSNDIGMDEVLLHILPVDNHEETDRRIRAYLQARLRVSPHVKYSSAPEILKMQFPEGGRKPVKFIDKRCP